jgi:predicted MFS family arabinose efflux permease
MLPTITTKDELQTANSLTQTTRYFAVTVGTFLGGVSVAAWGYEWAFGLNAVSFAFSALMISRLQLKQGHFRPERAALTENDVVRPWQEYKEGLRYLKGTPLFLAIAMGHVGWATGGGAAQILFGLFGDQVFNRGAAGIGIIWSSAGVGLLIGAAITYLFVNKLPFEKYKTAVVIAYLIHGTSYILFSQMEEFWLALVFIAISRASSAVFVISNLGQLLRHINGEFRGRVFSTIESMTWAMMILSLTAAGVASEYVSPRTIGAVAGFCSSLTALGWAWAHWTNRLPEPALEGVDPTEVEVHREPRT